MFVVISVDFCVFVCVLIVFFVFLFVFCRFVFGALGRISRAKTLTREGISLGHSSVKEICKFLLPRERISENSFADNSAQQFILPPRGFLIQKYERFGLRFLLQN